VLRLLRTNFTDATLKFNAEITLAELQQLDVSEITLLTLKQAGLVGQIAKFAKVIKSGQLTRRVTLEGIAVTAGAKAAIEAAGGSIA